MPRSSRQVRRFFLALGMLVLLPCLLGFGGAPSGRSLWKQADRAFRSKQYAQAADLYAQAQQELPQEWALHFNQGTALAAAQDYDQATKVLEQVAQEGAQNLREPAQFNIGNCYLAQGKTDQAIEYYKRALYLKPDDVNAKWNLELARRKQQQQQKQNPNQQQQQKQQKKEKQPSQQQQKQQNQPQNNKTQSQGQMNRQEAQRLLQSVGQQEQDLQRKLARTRQQPSRESRPNKDW